MRERSVEHAQSATATEEGLYIGCIVRQDSGTWRSGDIYIVALTGDRVYLHAKDMSLSGRRLNPMIYGAILQALGITPADLADPSSAMAALSQATTGDGGSFDVPGFPGDSGYATAYNSPELGGPIVLLAGFDLDASHLAPETIEHITPAVAAKDVVDRESLKAFVTAAGEYAIKLMESGDFTAAIKAKNAFRDPNGPWRHGSVYLYMWDLISKTISFHAAFPNTYELQPLRPVRRDVKTGELILPQLIAAAESGPEGGFVEYHFDDPNDDTDSVDIPKIGYVREFTGQIPLPNGSMREVKIAVGSGFYRAADKADVGQNAVIELVLPQIMRSVTASSVDAVSSRIERANSSNTAPSTAFSLGGASTLTGALQANAQGLADGTVDLGRLLANSSFTIPFNVADSNDDGVGEGSPFGPFTFWGSGDYRSISGGTPQSVDYDGSVTSANLGIDTRLGADLLAGVAVLWSQGEVDYEASSGASGELTTRLISVNPYLGWQITDAVGPLVHGRLRHRQGGNRRRVGRFAGERPEPADVRRWRQGNAGLQ